MKAKSTADLAKVLDAHLNSAGGRSPGIPILSRLFDVVYFASLKTEEGKPLRIRIALVDPKNPDPHVPPRVRPHRWKIFPITERLPLTIPNLVKLSKAADPWSSCLAVYFDPRGQLFVWGLIDQTVHFNTMLVRETESTFPPAGVFHVLTTGSADLTVYCGWVFVARLAQDVLLRHQNDVFWSGPISDRLSDGVEKYLHAVLSSKTIEYPSQLDGWLIQFLADRWIGTLCRILISIQRYGHGGAFLVTRANSDLDVKYGISYRRLPPALVGLGAARINQRGASDQIMQKHLRRHRNGVPAELYLHESIANSDGEDFENEITGCVRFISSLSCVDGLILASPNLSIRGFGVEIRPKKEVGTVYLSSEPTAKPSMLRRVDPNHYGTRHRSMMRYCFAHPKSVGFVISQDGEIRAMTTVRGRLVMWENLRVLMFRNARYKVRKAPKHSSSRTRRSSD